MEISDALVAFGGAVVGGAITGYYTLKATDKAIRDQDARERHREEKEIDNLLDALGVEIKTLWEFHMRRIGHLVEQLADGQPLEFYYPLTQDYFTIYHSNARLIGRIKNSALSEAIVVCYNKCKKVVDGFKYNNDLYRDWRNFADGSGDRERLEAKRHAFIAYARILREDHFELKGYVEGLLALLNQRSAKTL